MAITTDATPHPLGVKPPAPGSLHESNELTYALTSLMPWHRTVDGRTSYSACRCHADPCHCIVDATSETYADVRPVSPAGFQRTLPG